MRVGWMLVLSLVVAIGSSGEESEDSALPSDPQERVEALLDRARAAQERVQTYQASFVQLKESPLLLAPEESRGTFYHRAPDQIRWDFLEPTDTVVVLKQGESLTWYRDLGRVERTLLGPHGDRVLRMMGAGASLGQLERYFDLRVIFPEDSDRPYRLELSPSSSRVRRRLAGMTLELDRETYLPVFLRYEEPGGAVTEIRFEEPVLDAELAAELFEPALPADVEVRILDLGASP